MNVRRIVGSNAGNPIAIGIDDLSFEGLKT